MTPDAWPEVPLYRVAHARTGDKGNRLNVAVIASRREDFAILREQVTAERVGALLDHHGAGRVVRHELPRLGALNFVVDDALEGGVNGALDLDGHGKTHSFLVLTLPVRVPPEALARKESNP